MSSQIFIDRQRKIGTISPELFGGFIEHMGRAVYQGIFDPGSTLSDKRGFRKDVLSALKELSPTLIRYPGGNFLSGYHWMDGVGPRDKRSVRRDLAWKSIESNQFGTDEFLEYCRELGSRAMLGVNMGSGTIEEAASLVEYCNAPRGSFYSDLRAAHGHKEPYGVRHWCVGNEMDGPWQIGHLTAESYGLKALEAAKMMKWQDQQIKIVLCGSSGPGMPTYPEWDRVALEIAWEQVDALSMHYYANNNQNDTVSYLAQAKVLEEFVDNLAATLRYVQAKTRSKHQVYLSWDEWNVWYKNMNMDGGWTSAPHLIEEEYNLEDALVVAQWLNVFLRRCNVLRIGCLAQLVNVIAPILTRPSGLVRQTIFYPFKLFRLFAHGESLDVLVKSPMQDTALYGPVPLLDVSACYDEESSENALMILNRSLNKPEKIQIFWQGWNPGSLGRIYQFGGTDPKATNTFEKPYNVVPAEWGEVWIQDNTLELTVPPLSFSVLAMGYKK